jgi:cytochrome c oxidase cbb3-type subunit I/II
MSTFEGPMMSIKSVNALSHYTDWNIAHVHGGTLGWVGFMTFGMIYWLTPRLFQAPLHSKRLANLHVWIATIGIVLYVISMWAAGITQGLMWRAFDSTGRLQYPDFLQTVTRLMPMYYVRALGGSLYIVGLFLCAYNVVRTWMARPAVYAEPEITAPALAPLDKPDGYFHRRWEGAPRLFTILTIGAVVVASLFEIVPTLVLGTSGPQIAAVKPYTPLELYGRDIYLREGCFNCHSQMIRPFVDEVVRYGEYSKPGEFVYDHPFQWGSRRIGPDLAREGGKRNDIWHVHHMHNPRSTSPGSIMPPYPDLFDDTIPWSDIQDRVDAMSMLGVPYGAAELQDARGLAEEQAHTIAAQILAEGGPSDLDDREIVALIAYLQRLGADIQIKPPVTTEVAAQEVP